MALLRNALAFGGAVVVALVMGALSAAKIPMLSFEVAFLGWQFSLVRTAITLPVFIALGYPLERLIPQDTHTLCLEARVPTSSAGARKA